MRAKLDVVAAVVRHPLSQALLLTQRPAHKVRGGLWEFPGGKIESDESAQQALARELEEELGIRASVGPLQFILNYRYPDVDVRLQVHEITVWTGELRALEVEQWRWLQIAELQDGIDPLLAGADQEIARRLALSPIYRITPDLHDPSAAGRSAWLQRVATQLHADRQTVSLLRAPSLSAAKRRNLFLDLLPNVQQAQYQLLISRDVALALELGLGVQLSATQLADLPPQWADVIGWRAASCHTPEELLLAVDAGCDWVTLSPVCATPSHPSAVGIGWMEFQRLAEACTLPTYALGGMRPHMLQLARTHAAFGVAGISSFWPAETN